MAYYCINKMNNTYNQYKYQYLDHIETTIDIKQNYWEFTTQLFCINDYKLPPGSLVANLDIPYQEIKDISFFLASDQSRAQTAVTYNKKYSHIYESKFNVDVSANQFLKQQINNAKINCCLKLEMDPQVIKNAGISFDQEALDTLISETAEQKWDFSMYYTNTHLINKDNKVNNLNGYQLDNGHECSSKFTLVELSSNEYKDIENSIVKLVSISSSTSFQVVDAKVKFHYWLEESSDEKTLETSLDVDHKLNQTIDIDFNLCTSFDFENNKAVINPGGISGFNIPKYSHGYYELELQISQMGNMNKFIIRNEFNFIKNISKPCIVVNKVRINDLTNFKEVIYD